MPIHFQCLACRRVLCVADKHRGKTGPCTSCGEGVHVPNKPGIPSSGEPVDPFVSYEEAAALRAQLADAKKALSESAAGSGDAVFNTMAGDYGDPGHAPLAEDQEDDEEEEYEDDEDDDEEEDERVECPECCELIKPRAKICRFCGTKLKRKRSGELAPRRRDDRAGSVSYHPVARKSPFVAGLLSFLVVGVGQVYAGDLMRGATALAFAFFLGVVSYVFCPAAIIAFGFWAWNIADAVSVAEHANREYLAATRRPRRRR